MKLVTVIFVNGNSQDFLVDDGSVVNDGVSLTITEGETQYDFNWDSVFCIEEYSIPEGEDDGTALSASAPE